MSSFFDRKGVFVIAEVSANHGQDLELAYKTIDAAVYAGADAVKFQAYTPDSMTIDCDKDCFNVDHEKWGGQTLYQLYQKAYTPYEWFPKLKKYCDDKGITFFATAFDLESADMLDDLDVAVHKIASFEFTDEPLIKHVAKKGKPIIISMGMADLPEINATAQWLKEIGNEKVVFLKCISCYPADPKEMNLVTLPHMKQLLNTEVGLSDHSMGSAAVITAVALGATVIEKHFTLSRDLKTADSFFSMNPEEFKRMVEDIRIAEGSLGHVTYEISDKQKMSRVYRRSLFVVKDIKAGESFSSENVRVIRPSMGLAPKHYDNVIGKKACSDIERGTPLTWEMIKSD